MENTNVLFDRKRLVRLIVPLIVEQVLAVTVGMADMVMVSGAGETAVSGISLVNTICVLLIVIFTSMASGGSVVGAQFLGSGDKKTACHAAEKLVMICRVYHRSESSVSSIRRKRGTPSKITAVRSGTPTQHLVSGSTKE